MSGGIPANIEYWHAKRCERCKRLLTDPVSIELGRGPTCAAKLADALQKVKTAQKPEEKTLDLFTPKEEVTKEKVLEKVPDKVKPVKIVQDLARKTEVEEEVEPTSEEIRSVFMEEGNLETTPKNRELFYEKYNNVYTDTKKGYEKLISDRVAELKEEGFKGVTKGGVKRDEEGYVTRKFGATSNNPQWYRDFTKANNYKKPTNKDLREIAIQQLSQGHTEDYGEIAANPIFTKLEGQLESYETILSDI